jgi:hypothetical protein
MPNYDTMKALLHKYSISGIFLYVTNNSKLITSNSYGPTMFQLRTPIPFERQPQPLAHRHQAPPEREPPATPSRWQIRLGLRRLHQGNQESQKDRNL